MPATGIFVAGCITLFFGVLICSSAGVGGGGINVPILLLIFGYGFTTSVNYSYYMVLGNEIAQFIINLQQPHPFKRHAPLVNWELVTILSPAQLMGSNLGGILAKLFPDSVLYILAFIVISFALGVSFKKGLHRYHEETKRNKLLAESKEQAQLYYDDDNNEAVENKLQITSNTSITPSKTIIHLPWKNILILTIMFLIYLAMIIGAAFTTRCSASWSVTFTIMYLPLAITLLWGIRHLRQVEAIQGLKSHLQTHHNTHGKHTIENPMVSHTGTQEFTGTIPVHHTGNYDPDNTDTDNDISRDTIEDLPERASVAELRPEQLALGTDSIPSSQLVFLPVLVFGIGILCSLLGIGGGELLNPTLLAYHLLPQIVSGITITMGTINTTTLVFRLLITETDTIDTGMIMMAIGLTGGLLGRKYSLYLAESQGRASVLIFALVIVLSLSAIYFLYEIGIADFTEGLKVYC